MLSTTFVPYFHVVFTLPDGVAAIARQNKKVVYNILFRSASETLRRIAADPKHLGAHIGFLAVLHTWVLVAVKKWAILADQMGPCRHGSVAMSGAPGSRSGSISTAHRIS